MLPIASIRTDTHARAERLARWRDRVAKAHLRSGCGKRVTPLRSTVGGQPRARNWRVIDPPPPAPDAEDVAYWWTRAPVERRARHRAVDETRSSVPRGQAQIAVASSEVGRAKSTVRRAV